MNLNLDGLTNVLWTQLWQITLLIPLAIGIVRFTCRGRSHLAYVILLAVMVKCLVPPLWSSPTGMFSWASHVMGNGEETPLAVPVVAQDAPLAVVVNSTDSRSVEEAAKPPASVDAGAAYSKESVDSARMPNYPVSPVPQLPAIPESSPPRSLASIQWGQIGLAALLASWVCGTVGVVGYLLAKRIYLERFHDDTRVDTKDELLSIVSECAIALDLRHRPDLVVTTHPTIPFVVGWWSPRLVLPKHIVDRSTAADMRLIIAHELNHLRRWDTATNWIQLGVQAVWWFHPLVWWLNAEIRRWRESCCDEEVVARLKCQPSQYAHCLLNVLDFQASLRATSGLDSLSPFEVTKQRLQNIMQPSGQFPRSTPWGAWLAFVGLALIVLPGAAFTLPQQVAEAHDEIPTAPMTVAEPAVPPAPPVAIEITPDQPLVDNPPPPAPVVAAASDWLYKFDVHRNYQYDVSIEEDGLHGTTRHTGHPNVRATYVSGGFWALQISNPQLMSSEIPSPSQPFGRGFRPPRIPGPFARGYEVTIDAVGQATEESGDGTLPLFLGSWAIWLFSPLPTANQPATWEEEGTTTLSLMEEPTVGPFGDPDYSPFARRSETARLPAATHLKTAQSLANGILTLTRTRVVKSKELVDQEPRIELRDESIWSFDTQLGIPISRTGSGELILRQVNQTQKTPFKYTVRLATADGKNEVTEAAKPAASQIAILPPSMQTVPGIVAPHSTPVSPDKPLKKGQKFLIEWNGSYFPGEVIDVPDNNAVKIHYSQWSEQWDEIVPRQRLHEPAAVERPEE